MNQAFEAISNTRSLTQIQYLAEEAIADGATGNDLKYLNAILEMNDLDDIWILALLGEGKIDEAAALQVEVDGFKTRKAARLQLGNGK